MHKRFWQNLGLTKKDILNMPENEVRMLGDLMSIEEQYRVNSDQENVK